jgi:hypothetical protein
MTLFIYHAEPGSASAEKLALLGSLIAPNIDPGALIRATNSAARSPGNGGAEA